MYLRHFGLNEAPFRITPHTEFFFSGANRGATLEALLYAIAHDEGIVKVTGEVGSGKTMLCRVLVERLPKSVNTIYLANPSLSRDEILHVIATDLQMEPRAERVTILLRALQERLVRLFAAGRRVVVLIDEAHAMPLETLEEIRLLSNLESNRHKLLQIVLFGQPELDQHLALPNMRQLKERITHSFKLEPLVRPDVESYIDFRMRAAGYRGPNVFATPAMRLIARASLGLTRRINILADKSLLAAFAEGTHQITAKHARAAIRDSEYEVARWRLTRWWLLAGGLAAGLAIGFGVHWFNQARELKASAMPAAPRHEMAAPAATPGTTTPSAGAAGTTGSAQAAEPGASDASAPSLTSGAVAPSATPVTVAPRAAAPLATDARSAATSPTVPAVAAPVGPTPPASGPLVQERFDATQQWLKTAPAGSWTIQLLTVNAGGAQTMERFLEDAAKIVPLKDLYVYSVKQGGQQYYGVTYGNYPTLDDTFNAMGALPSTFKSRAPFHRSIVVMRRQNQE